MKQINVNDIKVTRLHWKRDTVATRFSSSERSCSNPVQSFTLHTINMSHVCCSFSRMYKRYYLQPRSSKQIQITCLLMMSGYLDELGHEQTLSVRACVQVDSSASALWESAGCADWLQAVLMNGAIKGETWRKQICWKRFLPWGAPAVWLTACRLLGWQAHWWMYVRVGIAGDKACSSLLPISASHLKNNFLVVARKSKLLNAVSSSSFGLWRRLCTLVTLV